MSGIRRRGLVDGRLPCPQCLHAGAHLKGLPLQLRERGFGAGQLILRNTRIGVSHRSLALLPRTPYVWAPETMWTGKSGMRSRQGESDPITGARKVTGGSVETPGKEAELGRASGPEEGLVLAERVHPDLVLVNAGLAQERDYWLLRGMRRAAEKAEIVVMAEAMSEAEGKAAMRRGASGYSETGKLSDLLRRGKRGTPTR